MATKIRLMRLGKMRDPYYRVVVVDSRTKRDGRSIETIGKYHPKEDPSFIEIDGARALHWLKVGAQPSEAVAALLRVTGTWQEFKGEPAPPPMLVKAPKADKKETFEAAHKAGVAEEEAPKARKAPAKKAAAADKPDKAANAEAAADAPAETTATDDTAAATVEVVESPAEAAEAVEAPAAEDAAPEAAAAEAAAAEPAEAAEPDAPAAEGADTEGSA